MLQRFSNIQVFGIGEIGKEVINACEAHHLDGLKYELFDGIK